MSKYDFNLSRVYSTFNAGELHSRLLNGEVVKGLFCGTSSEIMHDLHFLDLFTDDDKEEEAAKTTVFNLVDVDEMSQFPFISKHFHSIFFYDLTDLLKTEEKEITVLDIIKQSEKNNGFLKNLASGTFERIVEYSDKQIWFANNTHGYTIDEIKKFYEI